MTAFLDDAASTPAYLKTTSGQRLITGIIWLCTMLPLCIPKEVNSLRYFSTAAVSIIVYFVITMIIHSCQNGIKTGAYKEMVMFQTGNTAVCGIAIFIFAFGCQLNVFEVFGELYKPTMRRLTITSFVASGGCFVLYVLAGLFGYMDFGSAVTGSALKLYNPVKSPMMGVGYAGLMLKLSVGYGLHSIPVRECAYHVLGLECRTLAYWKHALIVTFLALCSLILGLFIPRVNIVFGISGGLCGGFIAILFPGLMYMYSGNFTRKSVGSFDYFATYLLVIVGAICIVWGTGGTVYSEVLNW
ncbi:amino acid permease [Strigomonas culicis]|uniref:Amino acid permease n=1 Tax=Strigomonas culicis TaxID=28005 RepID=S9W4Y4_9TRYP|nr:amino acid permease [Strigomonas culicis]|eukprot:EPY30955.1 amino acid permease [Strigomonas culicis]